MHKFVTSGTLEEKINIIESKKELAEQIVDAGEKWSIRMDSDRQPFLLLLNRDRVIDETN